MTKQKTPSVSTPRYTINNLYLLKQRQNSFHKKSASFHVSYENGDEDAAKQRDGRGREHHNNHAARHVDEGAKPRPHNDLSQLDHAGERGAVHPGAPLAHTAPSLLQLLLGVKSRKRERKSGGKSEAKGEKEDEEKEGRGGRGG